MTLPCRADEFDAGLRAAARRRRGTIAHGCVTLNGDARSACPAACRRASRSCRSSNSPWCSALHVAAAGADGVALDRLALEGVALGGPVLERAGLEIEVERLAVGPDGANAIGIGGEERVSRRVAVMVSNSSKLKDAK